jgi:hypothetical protein
VPLLTLGPQWFDDSETIAKPALKNKVSISPGWTTATFPHPLHNAKDCRNPIAHSAKLARDENSRWGTEEDAYFCDPDGVLSKEQAARIASHLVKFQKSIRVSCVLGIANNNASFTQPFYLGIAVMKHIALHFGEAETDTSRCSSGKACLETEVDWFGDGILNMWNMAFTKGTYCPNGGVIVISTTDRFARLILHSEYFVTKAAARDITNFVNQHIEKGDWEGGIHAAIMVLNKYFARVYHNEGYTRMYWVFMYVVSASLAIAAAVSIFGHTYNAAKAHRLENRDACWGVVGCLLYGLAAFISILGVHTMTFDEEYWNPSAEDSCLSFMPLIALGLCLCSIPVCCPLSFGRGIRDSGLNPQNWSNTTWRRDKRPKTMRLDQETGHLTSRPTGYLSSRLPSRYSLGPDQVADSGGQYALVASSNPAS